MAEIRRIHPTLPLFRIASGPRTAIYTPGHLAPTDRTDADSMEGAWRAGREAEGPLARSLLLRAQATLQQARAQASAPFAPECLAVSLGNRCNLNCNYCFTAGSSRRLANAIPEPEKWGRALTSAADLVACNCARKQRQFHLVLQGDGEPSIDWERLRTIVELTRERAASAGAGWFGYLSTNGILPESHALWLARNLSRVSLSCDGPPGIQDAQRPFPDGRGSSASVVRTARAIRSVRDRLDVRATITPATVSRQTEILEYLRDALGATHVRFEPVYRRAADQSAAWPPRQAKRFAAYFLAAQRAGQTCGVELSLSGVRLDEVHGPYCDTLRQTLRLTSAGTVTACFAETEAGQAATMGLEIGRGDTLGQGIVLDAARVAALRAAAGRIPDACQECVCGFHCSRGCPEECALGRNSSGAGPGGSFRCQLHKRVAIQWLVALLGDGSAMHWPES
jgi:uncharacterized protein